MKEIVVKFWNHINLIFVRGMMRLLAACCTCLLCASSVLLLPIAVACNGAIHVPERSGVDPSLVVDHWVCGLSFIGRSGFANMSQQQQQDMFLLLGRAAGLGSAASQGRL